MSYQFESKDGLCKSNNAEFVSSWNDIIEKQKKQKIEWIAQLRSQQVKASHPDDGWVNREENTVYFSYPQFDDGVKVGDVIALGWPDRWRLVKVIGFKELSFSKKPRYKFEPIEEIKINWLDKLKYFIGGFI